MTYLAFRGTELMVSNVPVTMSIVTEGAGLHFMMFLQHLVLKDTTYDVDNTPLYSTTDQYTNRWDNWTMYMDAEDYTPASSFGLQLQTSGPMRNITLPGTSWEDRNKDETYEERVKYLNSIAEKDGGIHYGTIHYYPKWIEKHFSNINVIFYLGESDETVKRCYNLFKIKNGFVPEFDHVLGRNNRDVLEPDFDFKNNNFKKPKFTVSYEDLFIKNKREAVRSFINFTLSTQVSEKKLDQLQHWINLYTSRNDELLVENNYI